MYIVTSSSASKGCERIGCCCIGILRNIRTVHVREKEVRTNLRESELRKRSISDITSLFLLSSSIPDWIEMMLLG